jgi:periplasmic protein TonB
MVQEENNNNRVVALIGTIVFHALLLLLFLFIVFKTPLPPFPEAGSPGIEVNFGTSEDGMGDVQPREATSLKNSQAPELTEEIKTKIENLAAPTEEAIVSQETEDAPEVLKEKPKTEAVTKPVETPVKEVEPAKPVVNASSLYKGKSKSQGGTNGSEGETGKAGDQGSPDGSMDSKYHGPGGGQGNTPGATGPGGDGGGISYSLGGRTKIVIPTPEANSQVEGKVVVEISVDKKGNVINAKPGMKGSTTTNSYLLEKAKQAALRAKFNAKPDAPDEQRGTIVYNFIVQ